MILLNKIEYEAFKELLVDADENDAEFFCDVLNDGARIFGMTDYDLSQQFGASSIVISRWRSGVGAPIPPKRRPIFMFFTKLCNDFILLK